MKRKPRQSTPVMVDGDPLLRYVDTEFMRRMAEDRHVMPSLAAIAGDHLLATLDAARREFGIVEEVP